jgi:hypothetical protein
MNTTQIIEGLRAVQSGIAPRRPAKEEQPDQARWDYVDAACAALAAAQPAEPLHITHGPLMRHAAALLRSRKPVLPDHESVAAELELAADGHPTPSGEPSAEWLEVMRIALNPAQPAAAPQGVAYAELRKEFDLWWNDQMGNEPGRDTSSDSRAFMPYKAWKKATELASHGQAPAGAASHPACKPDMLVNGGALKLALMALRRAGKNEIADELEATAQPAPATQQAGDEPLHITHGPLMRHAAALLRSRKPVLPDHESVAAELEMAIDGHPTPSGEPSAEWLKVLRIATSHPPTAQAAPAAGEAAGPVAPPNAITASVIRDDGGEQPAFCLMAAYRSEKDAMDALAMIAAAPTPAAQADSPWSRALEIRMAQGWRLKGDRLPVLYTDTINDEAVGRDDLWLCTTSALKPSAPQADSGVQEDAAPQAMLSQDVRITVNTLMWWRDLASINPYDLIPRIDAVIDAARKQGDTHD